MYKPKSFECEVGKRSCQILVSATSETASSGLQDGLHNLILNAGVIWKAQDLVRCEREKDASLFSLETIACAEGFAY